MHHGQSLSIERSYTSRGLALVLCGALGLCLTGCAQKDGAPSGNATTASVSASQAALAAAGRVVLACYSVPSCATVAPKPKIRSAYDSAYAAVTQAQSVADSGGTPDMVATTAAMATLQALIAQLPAPKSS